MTGHNETERLDKSVLKLAGILLVGAMAPLFDTTIVNVAIHRLGTDLHTSVATIQWVVTGYLLALAMVVPVTGWLLGRFGGRRMWLLALTLFLTGSVLSGLSWSVTSLIVFRVLQGLGGGMMLPILQTLLVQAAGRRRLGRLMAVVSLPAILGPILGPVLGGLLISHVSWRWIFFVNVPICVAALVLAWRGLPATPARGRQPFDAWGLVLLSPALAAIIYGLSQVGVHGGFAYGTVDGPLVAGLVLLAAFAWHALRGRAEPIVDLRLFRVRSFSASAAVLFLSGLSLYGAMLLLPLYYQQVRGQTALAAGLLLAPQGLGTLLSRPLLVFVDRIGARPIALAGLAFATLGTVPFALAGPDTSEVLLAVSLVVRGAGLGAVTVPVMAAAYQELRPEQVPHASGATRILQQVGGSFGTAVLAVILQREITSHAAATAYDHVFWWSLGFTALALVPALLLPGRMRAARGEVPVPDQRPTSPVS
ncbi:MAG TPA: MDR family MFS transporter [Streptosporangiaceae bacterium]|jgi:EmrB/QacA subfamily drug resistance transporter